MCNRGQWEQSWTPSLLPGGGRPGLLRKCSRELELPPPNCCWGHFGWNSAWVAYQADANGTFITCSGAKFYVKDYNVNCAAFPHPVPTDLDSWSQAGPDASGLVASSWKNTGIKTAIDTGVEVAKLAFEEVPGLDILSGLVGVFDGVFSESGEISALFKELVKWVKEYVSNAIEINNLRDIYGTIRSVVGLLKQLDGAVGVNTPAQTAAQLQNIATVMRADEGTLNIAVSGAPDSGAGAQAAAIAYTSQWGALYLGVLWQMFRTAPNVGNLLQFGQNVARWAGILRGYQGWSTSTRMKMVMQHDVDLDAGPGDDIHFTCIDDAYNDRFDAQLPHNKRTQHQYDQERTVLYRDCLLYTSPSPRDRTRSRMPSSA
eukprot:TRINITY_DN12188_c0_g1_i2.p1 TRINITY_DN12188_c0_g1~~TRINITY_DN12188_c0_g1_i2.p1  ORF type:complete len:373 (-),score=53.87 TRINITY_DN12188_c0_g1_i2:27-1145(-)